MSTVKSIRDQAEKALRSKQRNALIIEAKQNMLVVALMGKASSAEIEKHRQELIDAMTAGVDDAISIWKDTVLLQE